MHSALRWLIAALALWLGNSVATAECVAPSALAHSAVSIARYFGAAPSSEPDLLGIRGTGWFLSPASIATIEHVAAAMNLSDRDWTDLEIVDGDVKQSMPARRAHVIGTGKERIAVLELQKAYPGGRVAHIRTEPLLADEIVISVAYPDGRLRAASGRFVQYGEGGDLAGTALLEMHDGKDRLVLDHGASGAPILDCGGRVAAVVSGAVTQTVRVLSQEMRVSTPWGTPNVISVPVGNARIVDGTRH